MQARRVIILGAAGRDFHNFNVVFKDKPDYQRADDVYYEYEGEEMFAPGRIVQHPTFGRGKIMNAEGFGESLRLDIMFSGVGLKKIMAKYARLKVVG